MTDKFVPLRKGIFFDTTNPLNRVWWAFSRDSQKKALNTHIALSPTPNEVEWIREFQRAVLAHQAWAYANAINPNISNGDDPLTQACDLLYNKAAEARRKVGFTELIMYQLIYGAEPCNRVHGGAVTRQAYGLDHLVIEF